MKLLIFVACTFAMAGAAQGCQFDAQAACNNCPYDRNWVQYVADGCDCNTYYVCEKRNGVITYHAQKCDRCHCFSNETWSCSIQIRDLSDCPPSTYAPIDPIPTVPDKPDFWCVNFDHDWREKPVYYDTQQNCYKYQVGTIYDVNDVSQTGLHTAGLGLLTYGYPCNVEVPYFQNNQFRQFTFCGMFFWLDWYGSIKMGLAYNGYAWDCAPGSIRIHKTDITDQIQASVTTENGLTTTITHPNSVAAWGWHDFCLRFDGSARTLELTVDEVSVRMKSKKLSGLTADKKCNMRFGEVLEPFSGGYYIYSFIGLLDSFCFTPAIVPESHF